jgi:hypothetical protein
MLLEREQGLQQKARQKWQRRMLTTTTTKMHANSSSTQADEVHPKKRYRSGDSIIATMLGDNLDNFTIVFKTDVSEPSTKATSPEEI